MNDVLEIINRGSSVKRKSESENDPQVSPSKLLKLDDDEPGETVSNDQSEPSDNNDNEQGESINTSQSAAININCDVQRDSNNNDQSAAIDILNDDTLLAIFSYLTVKDLIRIERVSKKWKELSTMSWVSRRKMDFSDYVNNRLPVSHLEDVLKRAGDYVTHLNILDVWYSRTLPKHIFSLINKYCKSLTHLNLDIEVKGRKNLNGLSGKVVKNLKSLHIHIGNGRDRNADLSYLLKKAENLEDFSVSIEFFKGSSLINLTEKCKALSLNGCFYINNQTMEQVLGKLPDLEHLNISNTSIVASTLKLVSNQIKSLEVSCFFAHFFADQSYKNLPFSNLHSLKVTCHWCVNDDVISTLISKCPLLEILDLHDCTSIIKDTSFRQITKLKKLTDLNVSGTHIKCDTVKYLVSTLENLKKISCYVLGKESWLQLIELSPNLTNLTIGPSDQFEYEFFKSAEKCVEERSNKNPLTIQIYFSSPLITSSEAERLKLIPFRYQDAEHSYLKIVEYRNDLSRRLNAVEQIWCIEK